MEAFTSALSRQLQTSKHSSIEVNVYSRKVFSYYNSLAEKKKKKIKCHNVVVRVVVGK